MKLPPRHRHRHPTLPLAALTLALCCALAVSGASGSEEAAARAREGGLVLLLRPAKRAGAPVVLRLARIEALDAAGAPQLVARGPVELRSVAEPGGVLTRSALPVGAYATLRLTPLAEVEGEIPAAIDVAVEFRVATRAPATVFLSWDPDVAGAAAFRAGVEGAQLRSLLLFVTNSGGSDLTVVQRDRDEVVAVVQAGKEPMGIDADPGGRRVYVALAGADAVGVIDTSTLRLLDTIHLEFGARPVDVALSPDGRRLYVVSAGRATVTVFDTASLEELATAETGSQPARLALSAAGNVLYVANQLSNSVGVYDARTLRLEATVPVEARPREMLFDSRSGRLFVAHQGSDGVSVIRDNRDVERVLHYGAPIGGLALDDEGSRLYVSATRFDRLLFGQAGSEAATGFVTLPAPGRLVLDPDGKKIYVLDADGDRVRIVNRLLARPEGSIPTGRRPHDLVLLR